MQYSTVRRQHLLFYSSAVCVVFGLDSNKAKYFLLLRAYHNSTALNFGKAKGPMKASHRTTAQQKCFICLGCEIVSFFMQATTTHPTPPPLPTTNFRCMLRSKRRQNHMQNSSGACFILECSICHFSRELPQQKTWQ